MTIYKSLLNLVPLKTAYAHCDVPCGIYDPKPSQIAAATVLKMVQKIGELEEKKDMSAEGINSMTRYIWTKEEHARILKHELTVLWADFFKEEHLKMFPDLHDTFWKALKLASHNKQHVSLEDAQALVGAVDHIAEIFASAKAAAK